MKRLVLVRHASTAWSGRRYCGRTDLPLDSFGRRDARAAASWIAARVQPGPPIYASPLRRSAETADYVSRATAGHLVFCDGLREADFGAVEGATFEEMEAAWPDTARALANGESRLDWPLGERWSDLERRVTAAWENVTWDDSDDVVVVTHGVPARLLLDLALGAASPAPLRTLAPAQVAVLERDREWRLVSSWSPQHRRHEHEHEPAIPACPVTAPARHRASRLSEEQR